jgi:hypothetical protein
MHPIHCFNEISPRTSVTRKAAFIYKSLVQYHLEYNNILTSSLYTLAIAIKYFINSNLLKLNMPKL